MQWGDKELYHFVETAHELIDTAAGENSGRVWKSHVSLKSTEERNLNRFSMDSGGMGKLLPAKYTHFFADHCSTFK